MKIFSSIRKHLSWCFLFPQLWIDLCENTHRHLWLFQYSFHNLCPSKNFLGLNSSFLRKIFSTLDLFPLPLYKPLLFFMFLMAKATFYLLFLLLLLLSLPCFCFTSLYSFKITCIRIFLYILLFCINSKSCHPNGLTVGLVLLMTVMAKKVASRKCWDDGPYIAKMDTSLFLHGLEILIWRVVKRVGF